MAVAEATGGEVKLESLGARFVREVQYGLGAPPLAGLFPSQPPPQPGSQPPRPPGALGAPLLQGGPAPLPQQQPGRPGGPGVPPGAGPRGPFPGGPGAVAPSPGGAQPLYAPPPFVSGGGAGVAPRGVPPGAGGFPPQALAMPPPHGSRPATAGVTTPVYGPGGQGPAPGFSPVRQ
jgi:hypothetical protein